MGAFGGVLLACSTGPVLWLFVALYLAYEAFKTFRGGSRVTAFRPEGQRYLPFVEESFDKTWAQSRSRWMPRTPTSFICW